MLLEATERRTFSAAISSAAGVSEEALAPLARHLANAPLDGDLEARIEWIVALAEWLRSPADLSLPTWAPVSGRSQAARLWVLVASLRVAPAWRQALQEMTRSLFGEISAITLFTDVGLPEEQRFFSEAMRRVTRPLIPEAPRYQQLAYLVARLFGDKSSAQWLDEAPPALLLEALDLMCGKNAWAPVREQMADAIDVLCTRIAALGLTEDIRVRSSGVPLRDSPFMRAAEIGMFAAEVLRGNNDLGTSDSAARGMVAEVAQACRVESGVVLAHLEEYGVSVDLVYRLERIERSLNRIEAILDVLVPVSGPGSIAALHLISQLARDQLRDRSLTALVRANVRQLARKVIERAGETGEHYITNTPAEYKHMLRSAAGGGVLTAGTTVLKAVIAGLTLPFFFQGFFASLNYALSFVIMQLCGFTLATKQPSMTAATLAGALDRAQGRHHFERLADEIARTSRSQLAAVAGNIGAVIPTAFLFDLIYRLFTGHAFLSPEKSRSVIASMHPFESGTIFFAALTGVFLWLSSILAGSLENWAVYHRLPEAIERHRGLRRWFGDRTSRRAAAFFSKHISGFGGNISLGFLLGMCATMATFFGLPIDVRHVTLSTGSLVLSAGGLGLEALSAAMLWAAIGIVVIGTLNFGVSFALALGVALRAREVNRRETLLVARLVVRRLLTDPRPFFLPPKNS